MNAATETLAASPRPGRIEWLHWLRRELAPSPGRAAMTLRMVVAVAFVTIISMTLQTPETALSAYMVFFVTKENRVLTMLTGILMILGTTLAVAASLFLYRYTFDYPELRIPVTAATVFAAMYLSRVFVIGPLGFAIGFIIAITQSLAESAPDADLLARALLWAWAVVVFPIALTVAVNQILLPAHPWTALARALTQRLDAASSALQGALDRNAAGGDKNAALLELAARGSSPLLALLHFAGMKEAGLKRRHASLAAAIASSERIAAAAAALAMRSPRPLSETDRLCAKALLLELARLRSAVQELNPALPRGCDAGVLPELPEMRELQLAIISFHEGLAAENPADEAPAPAKTKKPLFVKDAFTNPSHARFALKVTLAAMSCYVLYTGVDWPGIHTAFITCCFIALENTGATIRKGWLRLAGCCIGGLLGFLSIMYLVPHMESIVSLVLLTGAVSAIGGWVASGSERISYAGLQIVFAFFMCIFQGFGPATDFTTIRDRLAGIILGIVVSMLVFHNIWPERAADRLRAAFAQLLRNLAQFLLIPAPGAPLELERQAAAKLHTEITGDLDNTSRLSELARFEEGEETGPNGVSPSVLEGMAEYTRAVFLIATTLAGETELEEWRRLGKPAQEAEAALRAGVAERLRGNAAAIEAGRDPRPGDPGDAAWTPPVAQDLKNDRLRLLHRLSSLGAGM